MSTIAHPRGVPSGPSGTTVAGFLVGAILTVAVGYGVVNLGEPVSGQLSQAAAVSSSARRGFPVAPEEPPATGLIQRSSLPS
jgi:hypothetical protein